MASDADGPEEKMKAPIAIKTTPLVEHSKEACGVLLASIKAQNAISVKRSHV